MRVLFIMIRKIQVFNDDRSSNLPIERTTASQVSWTTSSANAPGRYILATRSSNGFRSITRFRNAEWSPARRELNVQPWSSSARSIVARSPFTKARVYHTINKIIGYVHRVLKEERDIVSWVRPGALAPVHG